MKEKKIISVLCICILLVSTIVFFLVRNSKDYSTEFVPPPFDTNVMDGKPDLPDEYGWSELNDENIHFSVGLAGSLFVNEENEAEIYFYNGENNKVWIKLRVFDLNKNIIAETGLIKPGEHIKSIELNNNISPGEHVKVKVMSYEPETYYSAGAFLLDMQTAEKE